MYNVYSLMSKQNIIHVQKLLSKKMVDAELSFPHSHSQNKNHKRLLNLPDI